MAGASMNDIKARMKSVKSTMQITKAMELVATSKLRRARERLDSARPYYEILSEAIGELAALSEGAESPFIGKAREGKTLYVVIAGDRGLAGGYNSNIFKLQKSLCGDKSCAIIPVGKKACEHYLRRGAEIICEETMAAQVGVGGAMRLAALIAERFAAGEFARVILVYTRFVSMISQVPVYEQLLPLEIEKAKAPPSDAMIEEEPEELIGTVVPQLIGGIIYSALSEALASESGMRRQSMSSANKNASEMIDTLMLKYNRARQAVITQEITEIVSGAEAL